MVMATYLEKMFYWDWDSATKTTTVLLYMGEMLTTEASQGDRDTIYTAWGWKGMGEIMEDVSICLGMFLVLFL